MLNPLFSSYYTSPDDMKTSIILATILSSALTVKGQVAALGGNYVDPALQPINLPTVWLYWGESWRIEQLRE